MNRSPPQSEPHWPVAEAAALAWQVWHDHLAPWENPGGLFSTLSRLEGELGESKPGCGACDALGHDCAQHPDWGAA